MNSLPTDFSHWHVPLSLAYAFPDLLKALYQKGGNFSCLRYESYQAHTLTFQQGKLRSQKQAHQGVSIYQITNRSQQFSSLEGYQPNDVQKHLNQLPNKTIHFPKPEIQFYFGGKHLPSVVPQSISITEKKEFLLALENLTYAQYPFVEQVKITYQEQLRKKMLGNSKGFWGWDATSLGELRISITLKKDGKIATGTHILGSPQGILDFQEIPFEALIQPAIQQAEHRLMALPTPQNKMDVLITNGWGGLWLHEALGHLLEADVYAKTPTLNTNVPFDSPFKLVDNPTLIGGRGSYAFDDEGFLAQPTTLIENGNIQNVLSDTFWSKKLQKQPTSNARQQSYQHPPMPRMSNLILENGTELPHALLQNISKGLFIQTLGKGEVFPQEDYFTLEIRDAFLIENGTCTQPLFGGKLIGKLSTMLQQIKAVGNDFALATGQGYCEKQGQLIPISVGQPTVLLSGVEVHS